MSAARRFMQLDVFSAHALRGNPLAVVIDGEGVDDATMHAFARWTNLSETTFLLPPSTPQADYRVRIFTPMQELPFAGHPSVGSAYAAIEAGLITPGKTRLVQECAAGLLPVQVDGEAGQRRIQVQAPAAKVEPVEHAIGEAIAAALGIPVDAARVRRVDNGPRWLVFECADAAQVRAIRPDETRIAALSRAADALGLSVFGAQASGEAAMAVRTFCPLAGMLEDPVTGSANACIMAYLHALQIDRYGSSYVASQGREIGYDGLVQVRRDAADGGIWIGGQCALTVRGELSI